MVGERAYNKVGERIKAWQEGAYNMVGERAYNMVGERIKAWYIQEGVYNMVGEGGL